MAALSLATDLGLGQPPEHELGVCLSALELADRLGCTSGECSDVYYVALLAHVGCTAAAPYLASWVGGDEIHFQSGVQVLGPASEPADDLRYLVRRLADDRPLRERARLLDRATSRRPEALQADGGEPLRGREAAGLAPAPARRGRAARSAQLTERWDGKGVPGAVAGEEISRALRIVRVAHDFVAVAHGRDQAAAIAALRRRRGRGYDPAVVDAALAEPEDAPAGGRGPRRVGARDRRRAAAGRDDRAGGAGVGRAGVRRVRRRQGRLPARAFEPGRGARGGPLPPRSAARAPEAAEIRAAGFLHDLGRVAVPNGIWAKPGALSAGERERVRLHPYYTERVLERSAALAPLARLAGSHHERLDGSGYHRASDRRAAGRGGAAAGRGRLLRRDDPRSASPTGAAPGGGSRASSLRWSAAARSTSARRTRCWRPRARRRCRSVRATRPGSATARSRSCGSSRGARRTGRSHGRS